MRMCMIDPEIMCDKHLLGENGEIHKFRHGFEKGHSIAGRVRPVVQIVPSEMQSRHDELTAAMERRFGKKYESAYAQPDLSKYADADIRVSVDLGHNMRDLAARCEQCRARMENAGHGV